MQKHLIIGLVALISLGLFLPVRAFAQTFGIDNPTPAFTATLSGGTFIGGWHCEASTSSILIRFSNAEGSIEVPAATGTSRGDTAPFCNGKSSNGFGLPWNWNIFTDGQVTVDFLINGVQFASTVVNVVTPGAQFLAGAQGNCSIKDFPQSGDISTVTWQEFSQGFQLTDVQTIAPNGEPVVEGAWLIILNPESNSCGSSSISGADLLNITQDGSTLGGEAPLTGLTFSAGQVAADGSFSIDSDPYSIGDDLPNGCTRADIFAFSGNFLNGDSSTTQQIQYTGACGALVDCARTFSGTIEPLDSALNKNSGIRSPNSVFSKAMRVE